VLVDVQSTCFVAEKLTDYLLYFSICGKLHCSSREFGIANPWTCTSKKTRQTFLIPEDTPNKLQGSIRICSLCQDLQDYDKSCHSKKERDCFATYVSVKQPQEVNNIDCHGLFLYSVIAFLAFFQFT
jgi:hypothetical protein